MNWRTTVFIITVCLSTQVNSQDLLLNDLDRLGSNFQVRTEEKGKSTVMKLDYQNEIRLIASSVYIIYKTFISSQDANNCAFHPSCSTYAYESIRTNGLLGLIDTFDRLTRCNGFSPGKYPVYNNSRLFYDPVRKIHHKDH
jgi:putative component of membrane protein insertase Oxa1/YidC/SpoIIIJ protein YidD